MVKPWKAVLFYFVARLFFPLKVFPNEMDDTGRAELQWRKENQEPQLELPTICHLHTSTITAKLLICTNQPSTTSTMYCI